MGCEDKFRRHGEDWVLRHCYKEGGGFALRDLALTGELLSDGPHAKFYSTRSNARIDSAALAFFAVSVFWRAAARKWRIPGGVAECQIALGPYREDLRQYLLGRALFPNSAAIWICVSNRPRPSRVVTVPHSRRVSNCHVHTFDIPGVRFDLFLGRTPPKPVRLLCIAHGPERPILVSDAPDDILATGLDQLRRTTRLSAALRGKGEWSWDTSYSADDGEPA